MALKMDNPFNTQNEDLRLGRTNAHLFHRQIRDRLLKRIEPILFDEYWDSWQIVKEFEASFSDTMGYSFVSTVQSGSAGLRLCLESLGLKQDDEVITVANSDLATTAAISQCGGKIVFCDINPQDYCIDVEKIETLITQKTKGIIAVDMYGLIADGKRIREIADQHGLFVLEDATLSLGGTDCGFPVGHFADAAVFSTCPYKPFESAGGGGIVVTNRQEFWEKVEILKGFGMKPNTGGSLPIRYDHIAEGYNLKMLPFEAAVLLEKLPYLKQWSNNRRLIGKKYKEKFRQEPAIQCPNIREESEPIFRMYPICVPERDLLFDRLCSKGVKASLHYFPPVHMQSVYRDMKIRGSENLTETESVANQLICLPSDPLMRDEDISYISEIILEHIRR
ncbi:DegT/DnrJ/EryC1/StrS family aminotransferase [Flexilinea flocculi]|jgi:dTDP-4-amino-4,6-dideoxygalactose transaminase|uniref:dTDP-4-amino-4,6-dideoxygalactose transaminase n=1 Tax=Flexilinea flocculi TaxID=1678840 RepID=A0A0S7BVF7_9CHLR|nr:DegT/DnrJ/EryC1/StrS family aminotransferase [Flexilinea flocculi]GAP41489.1 dTDP-4-amino-4,6-dideoxygalactose transaminase [Flexilinea flocculi]